MPAKKPKSRHGSPRHIPTAVRIGVTGIVLGLLVVAVGALMNIRSPAPMPGTTGPGSTASTSTVSTSTGSATTTSSSVATTSAASNAGTSTSDPGDSATLPVDGWNKPMPVASLLPKAVAGYKVGIVETTTASAIVPLEPTNAGPQGKATIVVLTVFDKMSVSAARTYVNQFQRAYPKDLSSVTIGRLTGRFGTDGSHLAAVVFSRGRYAFEIVLTATRGAPRDLESVVLQAAEAFGATKTAP
jgi:hypothetical protein